MPSTKPCATPWPWAEIRPHGRVDNFCWCDPVQSEKTPDGRYKLAQLVRANQALAHFCQAYGVPCVSGKDSMKNDYTGGGTKISIPPTVLFTVMGKIDDVTRCVTSDFKAPGELIYLLGLTLPELGGSELAAELNLKGGQVPQVDALSARTRYQTLRKAIVQGLVSACHDLSDGGLAVALAEMAIAGRIGAAVDLARVQALPEQMSAEETLYSESASRLLVSILPKDREHFESLFADQHFALVGTTTDDSMLTIFRGEKPFLSLAVDDLVQSWKSTLDW
jgi:phosphoribosylformylglycinamidine synthase subunit PurSL